MQYLPLMHCCQFTILSLTSNDASQSCTGQSLPNLSICNSCQSHIFLLSHTWLILPYLAYPAMPGLSCHTWLNLPYLPNLSYLTYPAILPVLQYSLFMPHLVCKAGKTSYLPIQSYLPILSYSVQLCILAILQLSQPCQSCTHYQSYPPFQTRNSCRSCLT